MIEFFLMLLIQLVYFGTQVAIVTAAIAFLLAVNERLKRLPK